MKKIVAILFVLSLLLILCACSNVPDDFISSSDSAPSQEKADTYSFASGKDTADSSEKENSKNASIPDESHAAEASDRIPAANPESSKTGSTHSSGTNVQPPSHTSETASASKSESTADQIPSGETAGQRNAVSKAQSYLKNTAFSRQGLTDQLLYEKFTGEQAAYGADHCGANWNEQALRKAQSYLKNTAFSRQGLIDQLLYEKFTSEQAAYGADRCGANWNEQAARKAKIYLEIMPFSRESLINQLLYDKFTQEQAAYGAKANGL